MKKLSFLNLIFTFVTTLSIYLLGSAPVSAASLVGSVTGSGSVSSLGSSVYSLQIDVPSGINQFAPALSIDYNSNQSNHLLGLGWRLNSYSSITRCAALQYQDGFNKPVNFAGDRFCLNGIKLVVTSGKYGSVGATYRPENDPTVRVESVGYLKSWVVYYPDGRVGEFGSTQNATLTNEYLIPVLWASNKLTYSGYSIETEFTNDSSKHIFYPKRIKYLNNKVEFVYSERSDVISQYTSGIEQRIAHRLNRVEVYENGAKIHVYGFDYRESVLTTGESLLNSVVKCFKIQCMPKTTFSYQEKGPEYNLGYTEEEIDISTPEAMIELAQLDLNGDGYTDILKIVDGDRAKVYAFLNDKSGGFKKLSSSTVIGGPGKDKQYYMIDIDSDGRKDVLEITNNKGLIQLTVSTNNGDGTFSKLNATSDLGDWHNKLSISSSDFDGDGNVDLFVKSAVLSADQVSLPMLWKNEGGGLFTKKLNAFGDASKFGASLSSSPVVMTSLVDIDGDHDLDIVSLSREGIYLNIQTSIDKDGIPQYTTKKLSSGVDKYSSFWYLIHTFLTPDVNNDGLNDIVIIKKSDTSDKSLAIAEVMLNQGDYKFSSLGALSSSLGDWANLSQYSLDDVDFNGSVDIVRTFGKQISYHYNKSGGLFSTGRLKRISVQSLNDVDQYYTFDANGDGVADNLYVDSSGRKAVLETPNYEPFFLNKLIKVKNAFGYQELFEYKAHNTNNVEDLDKTVPSIPSPIKSIVVSKHILSNGVGGERNFVYQYFGRAYADGYGDLGFSKRSVFDETKSIFTEENYSQDWKNRRVGNVMATFLVTEGGETLSKRFNTYETKIIGSRPIYKNHLVRQTHFNFSEGVTTTSEYNYEPSDSKYFQNLKTETRCVSGKIPSNTTKAISCSLLPSKQHVSTTINTYYSSGYVKNHAPMLQRQVVTNKVFGEALPYQEQQESRTQTFDYDTETGLTKLVIAEPNSSLTLRTHYSYNDIGQLTSKAAEVTSGADIVRYTYAKVAPYSLLSITNEMGHITRYFYEDQRHPSKVSKILSPNNLVTLYQYDEAGNRIQSSTRDQIETTVFDWCRNCDGVNFSVYKITNQSVTAPNVTTYYDMFGRILETRQDTLNIYGKPDTRKETYKYDEAGQLRLQSRPYFSGESPLYTERDYDQLGRLVRENTPTMPQKVIQYYQGFYRSMTGGTYVDTTLNALGQIVKILNRSSGMGILYQYDAFGNLVKARNGDGSEVKMSYDIRGNRTILDDPDLGIQHFEYYKNGLLRQQTDAKGQKITFDYDRLGRKRSKNSDGDRSVWNYDNCANGIGYLCQKATNGFQETYTYSQFGNLTEKSTSIRGESFKHHYDYDEYHRLAQITYPSNYQIQYKYHPSLGFVERVHHGSEELWRADGFNESGLVTSSARRNGSIQFNKIYSGATNELAQLQSTLNGQTLVDYRYAWSPKGNLLSQRELQGKIVNDYRYGPADRLNTYQTHVNGRTSSSVIDSFNYSSIDTRQIKDGSSSTKSYQFEYATGINSYAVCGDTTVNSSFRSLHAVAQFFGQSNDISSGVFCYDLNGNTFSDPLRRYTYDADNRVVQIRFTACIVDRCNSVTDLQYDPDGQRYFKRVSDQYTQAKTTFYVGDYEKEMIGSEVFHRIQIGKTAVVYQKENQPAKTYYTIRDGQGSLTGLVSPSGTVERFHYSPYGKRVIPTASGEHRPLVESLHDMITHRGFTNQEHLEAAELIHMNGRIYDPVYSRFLTPDPFIHDMTNPKNYNRYSYVYFNPLRYIDPNGYEAVDISESEQSWYDRMVWPQLTQYDKSVLPSFRLYESYAVKDGSAQKGQSCSGQMCRSAGNTSNDHVAGATDDFLDNYNDMRDANTIGADKYFHCKANCEASQRGPIGERTAETISDTREWVDQNIKGDPLSASQADQKANIYGRQQGSSNSQGSCKSLCSPFRPNGLDQKY